MAIAEAGKSTEQSNFFKEARDLIPVARRVLLALEKSLGPVPETEEKATQKDCVGYTSRPQSHNLLHPC